MLILKKSDTIVNSILSGMIGKEAGMFPSPPSSHTTGRTVPLEFALCRVLECL
jgi:hypothetical protein